MEVSTAANLFNKNVYHHLNKNGDLDLQGNSGLQLQNGRNYSGNKNTPNFVNWNWPIIRKCTLVLFVSALLGMCGIIIAMITTLPTTCNPSTEWYKGGVFYEIFPASFKDTNSDGIGDLMGIIEEIDYFDNLGVSAIRLNSIFPSKNSYPEHYHNITTLMDIDPVLGNRTHFLLLTQKLHELNISLILDLPIYPFSTQLYAPQIPNDNSNETNMVVDGEISYRFIKTDPIEMNPITSAIRFWMSLGVDGFYIKGLENFSTSNYYLENILEWKMSLGEDHIMIISQKAFEKIDAVDLTKIKRYIDLVDVYLDASIGASHISESISSVLNNTLLSIDDGENPWVHWTLGGLTERRLSSGLSSNATLAATLLQLMLPGTPSIFYGDEVSLQQVHDPRGDHSELKALHQLPAMSFGGGKQFTGPASLPWLPQGAATKYAHLDDVSNMILLRKNSPSIYKNSVLKKTEVFPELNTAVRFSREDILILERWYPRRNTFISISNFSNKRLKLDLSSIYYSGIIMLGSSNGNEVYFSDFVIGPMETLIVKLHK